MQFYKRRQYIVNKAVQWASVIYVFVIVLAILAFHTWLTHWRLSGSIRTDATGLSLSTTLLVDVVITLAVTGVFTAFAVIFGSHKIAGPIYRCEQAVKRMQKGDLTDFIRLRKGDFLVPFSEEINLALANLRDIAGADRLHVHEAVRQIALAKGAVNSPEVQKSLDRIVETLQKIGRKLKIDQDAAKAIVEGAVGQTSQAVSADLAKLPGGRTETPIYSAAKTMMLQPPDRRTLRGEQRAPGAGLALASDSTLPAPAPAPVPGLHAVPAPARFDAENTASMPPPRPHGAPPAPYAHAPQGPAPYAHAPQGPAPYAHAPHPGAHAPSPHAPHGPAPHPHAPQPPPSPYAPGSPMHGFGGPPQPAPSAAMMATVAHRPVFFNAAGNPVQAPPPGPGPAAPPPPPPGA